MPIKLSIVVRNFLQDWPSLPKKSSIAVIVPWFPVSGLLQARRFDCETALLVCATACLMNSASVSATPSATTCGATELVITDVSVPSDWVALVMEQPDTSTLASAIHN